MKDQKASVLGRELLVAFLSVKHFRYKLEDNEFKLLADNQPLRGAINYPSERSIPKELRR